MSKSEITIILRGEKAEAFAQKLLQIEGVEQKESVSKGEFGKRITLAVNLMIAGQILSQPILNEFNKYNELKQIESLVRYEGKDHTFPELYELLTQKEDPITALNEDLPKVSLPSLREIAKLPIAERHKLLAPRIDEIAEEVNQELELNVFSVLDGEGIE
jgi:hypothetical protein